MSHSNILTFSAVSYHDLCRFYQAQEPHNQMILDRLDRTAIKGAIVLSSLYQSGLRLAQQVDDWTMVDGLDVVVMDGKKELKRTAAPVVTSSSIAA
jgi:hypothetical protein